MLFPGGMVGGKQADVLALHHKGDFVSVIGYMQMDQCMGPDGDLIQGYQVRADSVISARTVNENEYKMTGTDWLDFHLNYRCADRLSSPIVTQNASVIPREIYPQGIPVKNYLVRYMPQTQRDF
ncbi:hypothetical protein [Enterobacter mori]|uniref:hypothetical protein n=1 Tax=Enterobacter mori TaxID=539813 RepID=UPI003B83F1D5